MAWSVPTTRTSEMAAIWGVLPSKTWTPVTVKSMRCPTRRFRGLPLTSVNGRSPAWKKAIMARWRSWSKSRPSVKVGSWKKGPVAVTVAPWTWSCSFGPSM